MIYPIYPMPLRPIPRAVLAFTLCLVFGSCVKREPGAAPPTLPPPVMPGPADQVPIPTPTTGEPAVPSEAPTAPSDRPRCDIPAKIADTRELLASMPVSVGTTDYQYAETRNGRTVRFKEPERQIAAVLLDPKVCELTTTTFRQRGDELEASSGYSIEPILRASGIRWNNWATEYRVISPEGLFILAVKYPHRRETTATRTVRTATGARKVVHLKRQETVEVVHTPYCEALRTPEMVARGVAYLHDVVAQSRARLRDKEIRSRAYPDLLLTDVTQLGSEFMVRRAASEHMDQTEFTVDPARTSDRIHVIIGANGPTTSAHTCSAARACGLWQFTEGTYRYMRRVYPEANLLTEFTEGWRDHVNIAAAALLLDDSNLAELIERFGPEIADAPLLEEYLAAAYNAGVGQVIPVLNVARAEGVADWIDACGRRCGPKICRPQCLPTETKGYITKLRYLRNEWPQNSRGSAPDDVASANTRLPQATSP